MTTIFDNNTVIEKYAKGSSDPLGTEDDGDTEEGKKARVNDGLFTLNENRASSSASRPKKAKTIDIEEGLIGVFK
ncbi:hypothetical protein BAE44_0014669 [Dichanthelium oligosanthes]|uniref:Uncharacterized protein n=1 Tax=Dichanthelium oligosanthes TaxID=888268 RepID=A0A1E5VGR6_9POAL|nr:hypothetical protein BAE44_0014669 [Dichanthelium oligosanthes]